MNEPFWRALETVVEVTFCVEKHRHFTLESESPFAMNKVTLKVTNTLLK